MISVFRNNANVARFVHLVHRPVQRRDRSVLRGDQRKPVREAVGSDGLPLTHSGGRGQEMGYGKDRLSKV